MGFHARRKALAQRGGGPGLWAQANIAGVVGYLIRSVAPPVIGALNL